jgi:hypothetical protein
MHWWYRWYKGIIGSFLRDRNEISGFYQFFSLSIIRIHSPFMSISFPFVSNRRSWLWRRRRRTGHDPGGSGAEDTQVPSGRTAWAEGSLATRTAKCGTVQLAGSMATLAAALPSRLARPMRALWRRCPRDPRGQVYDGAGGRLRRTLSCKSRGWRRLTSFLFPE